MNYDSLIYIAGHTGMVGSAILKKLKETGYNNIITRTHSELDLTRQTEVEEFFYEFGPEYVFLSAAKVGGISANSEYPAQFIYDNLSISLNIINSSYKFGVKKLLNLGSSCVYPKMARQPIKEEYLLNGQLEPTNEAYAIAKISAIKLCHYYNKQYGTNYLSAMPTNLYGLGDNYNVETSHVIPALIRKIHEAKINQTDVILWGDGSPYREFLFSEDLADAVIYLMNKYNNQDIGEFINIGCGEDLPIKELAKIICAKINYQGKIIWDTSKPNGTPRKLLDVSKLSKLGWIAKTTLDKGLEIVYNDFITNEIKNH